MPRHAHLRKARREFLAYKERNNKESTVRQYSWLIKDLVEFCEREDVNSTSDLDGWIIHQWMNKRQSEDEVAPATLKTNVKSIKAFLRWCESNDLIEQGFADKIDNPNVADHKMRSDEVVREDRMDQILDYYSKYNYATNYHTAFRLLWHVGCRASSIIALDLDDYHPRDDYIHFQDREKTGTPLKNGKKGERIVSISRDVQHLLNDYIEGRRTSIEEDSGREPLFTTPHGRINRGGLYKAFTAASRPCVYKNVCPHDRKEANCEAALDKEQAPSCPSSKSLHPIRRGVITKMLNEGFEKKQISHRCDVSEKIINKHYDNRTEEEKQQTMGVNAEEL
jgi:site-specific recombinase XerD